MLPFTRILEYGNIAPPKPKPVLLTGRGGGYAMFLLYDNGDLYGIGSSSTFFGDGISQTYTSWVRVRSSVKEVYNNGVYTLIKSTDDKYFITSGYAPRVTGDSTLSTADTWVEITDSMVLPSALPIKSLKISVSGLYAIDINNDLYVSGYGRYFEFGINMTSTKWYKAFSDVKKVTITNGGYCTWLVTNSGVLYRAGTNSYNCLGTGSSTSTVLKTFTVYDTAYNDVYCRGYLTYLVSSTDGTLKVIGKTVASYEVGNGTNLNGVVVNPTGGFTTVQSQLMKIFDSEGQHLYYTLIVDSGGVKVAGDNRLFACGTGVASSAYFTSCVGLPTYTPSDDIQALSDASNPYILYNNKLYGAGYAVRLYGTGLTGYINRFVELELPL